MMDNAPLILGVASLAATALAYFAQQTQIDAMKSCISATRTSLNTVIGTNIADVTANNIADINAVLATLNARIGTANADLSACTA